MTVTRALISFQKFNTIFKKKYFQPSVMPLIALAIMKFLDLFPEKKSVVEKKIVAFLHLIINYTNNSINDHEHWIFLFKNMCNVYRNLENKKLLFCNSLYNVLT